MKKTFVLLTAILGLNVNAQWSLTGNSGTNSNSNFLGTTDNQSLVFKTNNTEWMKLTTTGRIIFQNIDAGLGWDNNLFLGGGNETATGKANTSVGLGSLINNSTGIGNSAFGSNAGRGVSTGSANTAIGSNALMGGIVGNSNSAFGANALNGYGFMAENTAVGHASMARYNFTSDTNSISGNTSVGYQALLGIVDGNYNSVVGRYALVDLGTGSSNVAIGNESGKNLFTGNNNIYIGANTNAKANTMNNELNIGNWIFGNNGTIGIGQFTYQLPADGIAPDGEKYKLFVKDGIRTEKVKVDIAANNGWADYVFQKEYQLMPLKELEQFINKNGHLPEVPTTEEAIKNGIELKEMNILLLKKVEELTLHLIDQNKELSEQKAEIIELKKQMNLSK